MLQSNKFVKIFLQVQVEVENIDKAGNFIGWLWIDNMNLSEALVKEGFAEIHSTAVRSPYYRQLQNAEEEAQKKKLRVFIIFYTFVFCPVKKKLNSF